MCAHLWWKCAKKAPLTETVVRYSTAKISFGKTKPIANRFRYPLSELRFFSLRILSLRLRLSVNVFARWRTHTALFLFYYGIDYFRFFQERKRDKKRRNTLTLIHSSIKTYTKRKKSMYEHWASSKLSLLIIAYFCYSFMCLPLRSILLTGQTHKQSVNVGNVSQANHQMITFSRLCNIRRTTCTSIPAA